MKYGKNQITVQHRLNFENKMKVVRIYIRVKWSLEELYTYKNISCE